MPKTHSLGRLLTNSGPRLKLLTAETKRLIRLRDKVRCHLPPALAVHCLGAELEDGTLVIYMDSAATATPVRYRQRELWNKLAADNDWRCTSIKVQILPEPALIPIPKSSAPGLSNAVRQILENTAAGLEEGPLSHSLRRLSRNRTPRR